MMMVLHARTFERFDERFEPGMPGAGAYREHDILVVGADGADDNTGFPYVPWHNIISA